MNFLTIRKPRHSSRSRLQRWIAHVTCLAGLATSNLFAADVAVTAPGDAGPGTLRDGLGISANGDRLVFSSALNGMSLANGSPLAFDHAVTLLDQNSITITETHAYTLATPLTVDWKGTLNLNGVLFDGASAGSLIKTGIGTLTLSQANTFSGGTTLVGGTLHLFNDRALGTGLLTVNNQVGNAVVDLGNGANIGNNVLLKTNLVVNNAVGTTSQLSGIISELGGSFELNKTGTGTLILSGANTFSGGVYVSNDSTIRVESSNGLGTGKVTVAGALNLDLGNGINVGNHIFLGNHFTANVSSGTATLSGVIDEVASSQLTKTGTGTLILTGANSYTGGTVINQGTLQGNSTSLVGNIFNSGTVVFDQSVLGHFDGNISGSGDLVKTGAGTVIFNGTNSYAGMTSINQGELQVHGSTTSNVNVANPSATLSGDGSVGSVTNDGTVRPGTSTLGDLNVNGSFTQHAGGTTVIGINSAGNTPGVNNGHLNVTGNAALDGTLNVAAQGGGTYTSGTQYTILNSTGTVTGQFSSIVSNLSMFSINAIYDPQDIMIQLQRKSSLNEVATTQNQSAVGTALDNITLTSTGGLFDMINTLGAQSAADQRQSLNQLSGDIFGSTQTIGLQVGDVFQQRLNSRLINNGQFLAGAANTPIGTDQSGDVRGQSPDGSTFGWLMGYGVGGNLRSDNNAGGVRYSQGGGLYGIDFGADETGVIGITGGNSYVGFHDGLDSSGQLTAYQVGLYALKHNEHAYWLGSTNYGYDNFGTNRTVTVGGQNQFLHGNYDAHQLGAYTEAGLKLHAGLIQVQPLIGLQYLYLAQQGFSESGGPAALNVSANQANSLRTQLGGRLVVESITGKFGEIWTPYWHGRWVSELLDNDHIVNASFNGAPIGGVFTSHGNRLGTNYGILGKGLQVQLNEQWSLFGNYDLMIGGRIDAHTGSFGAVYVW